MEVMRPLVNFIDGIRVGDSDDARSPLPALEIH
jgi:hypothetical protein